MMKFGAPWIIWFPSCENSRIVVIHALVADGVFLSSGTFQLLPPLQATALCDALRHQVSVANY